MHWHARAPRYTGTQQHEADVIVTDDGGRKKAGLRLRRNPKVPIQILIKDQCIIIICIMSALLWVT
jgi:hypothetical protein